ncbi:unnamed protein product [Blepharisma stoltei]|uniref:Transmembrane protein n=1 Tax=Blepharisma stoltei TaxID=1481888 RepID=A0AAU9JAF8_9CILI|nr:unnamed protein product [Blepharisma stoltei]
MGAGTLRNKGVGVCFGLVFTGAGWVGLLTSILGSKGNGTRSWKGFSLTLLEGVLAQSGYLSSGILIICPRLWVYIFTISLQKIRLFEFSTKVNSLTRGIATQSF